MFQSSSGSSLGDVALLLLDGGAVVVVVVVVEACRRVVNRHCGCDGGDDILREEDVLDVVVFVIDFGDAAVVHWLLASEDATMVE